MPEGRILIRLSGGCPKGRPSYIGWRGNGAERGRDCVVSPVTNVKQYQSVRFMGHRRCDYAFLVFPLGTSIAESKVPDRLRLDLRSGSSPLRRHPRSKPFIALSRSREIHAKK